MVASAMDAIQFFAAGIPKAQPRPRAFARFVGGKAVARVYEAGTAEAWKGDIARAAQPHRPPVPIAGPIRVDVDFVFPRPQRLLTKKSPAGRIPHTSKPDRDNLDKAALDCLTTLGFWPDDASVCQGEARKWYAAIGELPGADFTIQPLSTEAP